jgi:Uma2 family endonuclease
MQWLLNIARRGVAMSTVISWDPVVAPVLPPPPEDALYEIVDGQYEVLPPMGTQAGLVVSRLARKLGVYAEGKQLGEVVSEILFGLTPRARRKYRPDVAYVSYKRWAKGRLVPQGDPWTVVPDLVTEVVSPTDIADGVQQKAKEYLQAGVSLVWLVYPQLGWVVAYESFHRIRGFTMADELEAESVLPGFRLPMSELFSDSAAPPPNGESAAESEPAD